ncbi:MAG TPA: hypothetical protein DEP03_11265 [Massilia sp.]|nr:hypothetical protein [Massilia sp.]
MSTIDLLPLNDADAPAPVAETAKQPPLLDLVHKRRAALRDPANAGAAQGHGLVGLALSGGGVRSASFCAGVLAGLQKEEKLRQVDIVSTVSGGGYVPLSLMANSGRRKPERALKGHNLYRMITHNLARFNSLKSTALVRSGIGLVWGVLVFMSIVMLGSALISAMTKDFSNVPVVGMLIVEIGLVGLSLLFRAVAKTKWAKSAFYHYNDVLVQSLFAVNVMLAARFFQVQHWYFMYAVGAIVLALLAQQNNPRKRWVLYSVRGALAALLGNGRAVLVASCVLLISTMAFLEFHGAVIAPHVEPGSGVYIIGIFAAISVLIFWILTRSNAWSMLKPYQRYLDALIPGKRSASSRFADAHTHAPWFPICVANISILSKGTYRHASISPVGVELPNARLYTWDKVDGEELTTCRGAMALSGAAIDVGITASRLRRYLLTTFGVNTGIWLRSDRNGRLSSNKGPLRLVDLMLAFDDGLSDLDALYMKASDGGHFENTGIYFLLKSRATTIYSFDVSYDPDDTGESLRVLRTRARQDFGIDIALAREAACVSEFDILYRDGLKGKLYYVRHSRVPTLATNWAKDVSASFPHDSTFNQFLSADLFDVYYELGETAAAKMLAYVRPRDE